MAKEPFLLVSLKEDKAKKLAHVISNESCRKILDYLSKKEHATESQIAKDLNIPISTVHYNLKQLVSGNLVTADEFNYSEKGREVLHYKLANKYIIIAPQSTYGIKEKLRSILPVTLLIGLGATFFNIFKDKFGTTVNYASKELVAAEAPMLQRVADESVMEAAPQALDTARETAPVIINNVSASQIALWFFIGGVSALVLYLLIDYFIFRRDNR